jgi:hypothetical protein
LGQSQDYTALVIAERRKPEEQRDPYAYHVRHIERLELGTSYPTVVKYITALLDRPPLKKNATLVLDLTGVGRPVFDMFQEAKISCPLYGESIHGGDQATREGRLWRQTHNRG